MVEEDNALKCYLSWPKHLFQGFLCGAVGIQVAGFVWFLLRICLPCRRHRRHEFDPPEAKGNHSVFWFENLVDRRGLNACGTWAYKEERHDLSPEHTCTHTASLQDLPSAFPSPAWRPNDHCIFGRAMAFFLISIKTDWLGR